MNIVAKKVNIKLLISILLVGFMAYPAFSQQTIITIPSSEVLPQGDVVFKQSNRFQPYNEDPYAILTPSFTFGVGKGFELSTGVKTTLDGNTLVRGDFGAKKVFYLGSASRVTVGGSVSPYYSQNASPDTFVYSHFTHRIKKTKTSLTAGMYSASKKNYLPNRTGVLLGVEQVVIPNKLRVVLDWTSRDDMSHFFAVGVKYRPVSTVSITSAVLIPNKTNETISFNISVSKYFSLKKMLNKQKGTL